jgi:hypothetical protein
VAPGVVQQRQHGPADLLARPGDADPGGQVAPHVEAVRPGAGHHGEDGRPEVERLVRRGSVAQQGSEAVDLADQRTRQLVGLRRAQQVAVVGEGARGALDAEQRRQRVVANLRPDVDARGRDARPPHGAVGRAVGAPAPPPSDDTVPPRPRCRRRRLRRRGTTDRRRHAPASWFVLTA